MLSNRGRKKKLIVALHFQFANQAGWKCDECRKRGLEAQRGCGWLEAAGGETPPPRAQGAATHQQPAERKRPVWARRGVASLVCPHFFVSGVSLAHIEEFFTWKLFGQADHYNLPAKTIDAFFVLEREWLKEQRNGQN